MKFQLPSWSIMKDITLNSYFEIEIFHAINLVNSFAKFFMIFFYHVKFRLCIEVNFKSWTLPISRDEEEFLLWLELYIVYLDFAGATGRCTEKNFLMMIDCLLLHFASKDLICTTISSLLIQLCTMPSTCSEFISLQFSGQKKIKTNISNLRRQCVPNANFKVQFFALFLERVVLIESSLVDPPVELSSRLDFLWGFGGSTGLGFPRLERLDVTDCRLRSSSSVLASSLDVCKASLLEELRLIWVEVVGKSSSPSELISAMTCCPRRPFRLLMPDKLPETNSSLKELSNKGDSSTLVISNSPLVTIGKDQC